MKSIAINERLFKKQMYLKRGENVLWLTFGYLILTYIAIYLLDARGVSELTAHLDSPIWTHIYQEAGPTELFQWSLLAGFSIVSAYLSGLLRYSNKVTESRFWFLLAVLGAILVIEDAGDTSHIVRNFFGTLGLETARNMGRLMVYSIYGVVAIFPIVTYLRNRDLFSDNPKFLKFLFVGYILYAIVAFTSASQSAITTWYAPVGDYLLDNIGNGSLSFVLPEFHWAASVGALFMDTVVEESVELVSAAFLFTGSLVYLNGWDEQKLRVLK